MTENVTPRQAARWFASRGFAVLPLHGVTDAGACTCGSAECHSPGKHPFAEYVPHGLKNATTDLDEVRRWFAGSYWLNYGIITDQLLTVDVDVKRDGLATWAAMCSRPTRGLVHTWQVRTGSGGLHVIFSNETGVRCGELDKGIDLRGAGGYIVGAACRHASGGIYQWLPQCSPKDAELAAPPDWLLTIISTRSHLGKPTSI